MSKTWVPNTGTKPQFIGGKLVHPGEGAFVDSPDPSVPVPVQVQSQVNGAGALELVAGGVRHRAMTPVQAAAFDALVSDAGNAANLLALASNPPRAYDRAIRFKRSALSAAVSNFVALIDLNSAAVQARMLPDGGNVSFRDSAGAALPFHLHRRKSVSYNGGAWCWFEGPRAVYNADSGTPYTFYSYVSGKDQGRTLGSIMIARLDHATNTITEFALNSAYEIDDHNSAGIWIRPDGRIVTAYSRHNADGQMRFRVSTNAYDVSAWGAETTVAMGGSDTCTYANLVYLSGSNRLYNFFRFTTAAWAYMVSTDQGLTWSAPVLYARKIGAQVYQVMRATGPNRVDILTTDGHPDVDGSISVYHMTMGVESGSEVFRKSDGSAVSGAMPYAPQSDFSTVYAYAAGTGNGWLWDIARNDVDEPVALYQRKTSGNTLAEYRWAKFTAGAWADEKIADAGMDISTSGAPDEPNYLAGMSLCDYDATRQTLWMAASPGLTSHAASGLWNLYKMGRVNGSWQVQRAVTANDTVYESGQTCLARPVVPRGQPANTKAEVLFMSGSYPKWDNYNTEIMCWPPLITGAYVRIPALSSVIDTTITMRMDSSAASLAPLESPSQVWQDAYFALLGETNAGQSLIPDVSGNGQHCTTLLADVDRTERSRLQGTAVLVDAATSATAMRLPTSPALSLASATAWTLLADVSPAADGTNTRSLFSSWQGTNTKANALVRLNTDGTLSGLVWGSGGASIGGQLGAAAFANGAWQSLAVTFDATAITGYRNGTALSTPIATGGATMNAAASDRFSVGASPHNAALTWKGAIQGPVLFKTSLSAAWIKAWSDNRLAYSSLIEMGDEQRAL